MFVDHVSRLHMGSSEGRGLVSMDQQFASRQEVLVLGAEVEISMFHGFGAHFPQPLSIWCSSLYLRDSKPLTEKWKKSVSTKIKTLA